MNDHSQKLLSRKTDSIGIWKIVFEIAEDYNSENRIAFIFLNEKYN
jgi:hypothetical protein